LAQAEEKMPHGLALSVPRYLPAMFDICFTESAMVDIAWFQARDRRIVFDGIQQQLADEPVVETRNRKKL
jgi:hypothetical protein